METKKRVMIDPVTLVDAWQKSTKAEKLNETDLEKLEQKFNLTRNQLMQRIRYLKLNGVKSLKGVLRVRKTVDFKTLEAQAKNALSITKINKTTPQTNTPVTNVV